MKRLLLGAIMFGALAVAPSTVVAQDHPQSQDNGAPKKYYDAAHKETHEWNDNESTNWNKYRDDHHVKQTDFARTSKRQQQDYWNWRHEHPDTH